MKITFREAFYGTLLLFILVAVAFLSKPAYWYALGTALWTITVLLDYKYSSQKPYWLYLYPMGIAAILLPKIILCSLIWILPGGVLSSALFRKYGFRDRVISGVLFTLVLMLISILWSYLGLPINQSLLIILFLLPLLLLLKKTVREELQLIFKKEINYKLLFSLMLLFTITLAVFSPFLNETKLPQTTAAEYYSSGKYVETSLLKENSFPLWEIKNTLGQARYTLDTPLYFWMSAVTGVLAGKGLLFVYNPLFLFLMLFLTSGLYLGLLKLINKNSLAILGATLFITAEPIGHALGASGNMKAFAAFALAIIPFYFFTRYLETKERSDLTLVILGSGISLLAHIAPIHLLFAICFLAVVIFVKEIKALGIKKLGETLLTLGLIGIFLSFWVLPFLKYVYKTISQVDAQLKISLIEYAKTNLVLAIVAIISVLVLAYFIYSKKERWETVLVGAIPLLFIIPYVYDNQYLSGIFSLFKIVEFHKTEVIFFLAVTFLVVLMLKNLLDYLHKKVRWLGITLITSCFIFAAISGYQLHNNFKTYVSEEIHSEKVFTNEFNFVKNLPPGNAFTFGVFGLAIDGAFYDLTNHPTIGIGFAGAQESYLQYRIRMDDGQTIYENTRDYITNIFKLSGTKYLFINRCSPGGDGILKKLFYETYLKNKEDPEYKILYGPKDNCFLILELENVSFARKVKLAQLGFSESEIKDTECIRVTHGRCLTTPKFDKQLYNRPDGFEIIWSEGEGNYVLKSTTQEIPSANEEKIEYSRTSDTEIILTGKMSNDWIYIAESYFPRWKAYDEERNELEIRKTNLGTMAIKVSGSTKSITLEYKFPLWEKGLYALSLIAIIGLGFLFWLGKRKEVNVVHN
ncbi:hypothetical protein HZC32_01665 [Candidatus Woesearchaeota archaeon]|nr:hypothetical protein [Candidatus Woesearchaeota archaeon]